MKRGLVIGKFYPPHKGHKYLIDQAQAHCDELDVLICDSEQYAIPAETRQQWLQTIHPTARIQIIPDIGEDDNSEIWAAYTTDFLGYNPDVVFSSENYGQQYAFCMDAHHHMVDHERQVVPISATRVRKDIVKEWPFIEHAVRKDLAIRVVVIGAESTGTTTLAKALAKHYETVWVPEFGRMYSEGMVHTKANWNNEDFTFIATKQQQLERKLATKSNGLVICDTNATATAIWQQRYLDHISEPVAKIAAQDIVHLYLLTGDEIPFEQDGTRDGEHIRHEMHGVFVGLLEAGEVPFITLRGSKTERLKEAITTIDTFLKGYEINGN